VGLWSCSLLFFSRPRSEGWPQHGRIFSIYPCPLSLWLTLPRAVLSTSWCCPSRPCMIFFLAFVHLALFLALFLSPGNSLVSTWCDHSMLPRTSQTIVAFCRTLVVAHCGQTPMTRRSCSCREHIGLTNSVIGVSRLPVLDYGTTIHPDYDGRDLTSTPSADGWPLMWVSHPLQVSQLGQLSLSSFRGR